MLVVVMCESEVVLIPIYHLECCEKSRYHCYHILVITFLSFAEIPHLLFQIVDDMKYTVSHVVEPVEKGFAKINKTLHRISENVKRYEEQRRRTKDDSYLIPMNSWSGEFSEVHDNLVEGSVSDSGLSNKPHHQSKASVSRIRTGR